MEDEKYAVVLVTAKDMEEGRRIAGGLLDEKLAACVNIIPGAESHYVWEGERESAAEVLLLIKGRMKDAQRIARMVRSLHSYDVPEIIALPVTGGDPDYLKWLGTSTA